MKGISYLYAGGDFTTAGGAAVNRVARWDTGTSSWSGLADSGGSGTDGVATAISGTPTVYALDVHDDDVYIGGHFRSAGDLPGSTLNVARWESDTQTWYRLGGGSGAGTYDIVRAIAVSRGGGYVHVGGDFTVVDDGVGATATTANYAAVWNVGTSAWDTYGSNGGVNNSVYAIAFGDSAYLGGSFGSAGTVGNQIPSRYLGRFEALSPTVVSLTHFHAGSVYPLNGAILLGGLLFGLVAYGLASRYRKGSVR